MNVSAPFFFLILCLCAQMGWTASPSRPTNRSSSNEAFNAVVGQFKMALADLQHEIRNHEAEIHICEEKLQNQESALEELRRQLGEDIQMQRDFSRASTIDLEGKMETLNQSLTNLETMIRGVMTDVRQLKTQANDSVSLLAQYKQKFSELDALAASQGQHLQALETALHSMMELYQSKAAGEQKEAHSDKNYKVQSGDTLEKIARTHKVSLQALRDANQLAGDRIIVGQTLKIP